jgi:class 3 adenylate cyclase
MDTAPGRPPASREDPDAGLRGDGDEVVGETSRDRHGDDELRAWLVTHGVDPDDVDTLVGEGRVEALASDLVLDRGAELSAREVAAQAGIGLDKVVGTFHDLGVAVPDLDEPQFTRHDVVFVQRMSQAAGLGIVQGPDLLRVVAGSMERIAEAAVAVYVQGPEEDLRRRWASVFDCARSNMLATELALDLGAGLGPVFRHHMRQAVTRQRVIQEGVTRRELARLAIGFVDLVGSTALQAGLDPAALGEQVSRFEARAFDVTAAGGGRIVKFIGDAIMIAAVDPVAGVRIVADLVAAFTDDGTQPRGGLVFGEVLFRHGDYYGPVVNLAARLVDAAIPGEALVDGSVVTALKDDDVVFEPAGRRMLKGFATPVPVWSLATEP